MSGPGGFSRVRSWAMRCSKQMLRFGGSPYGPSHLPYPQIRSQPGSPVRKDVPCRTERPPRSQMNRTMTACFGRTSNGCSTNGTARSASTLWMNSSSPIRSCMSPRTLSGGVKQFLPSPVSFWTSLGRASASCPMALLLGITGSAFCAGTPAHRMARSPSPAQTSPKSWRVALCASGSCWTHRQRRGARCMSAADDRRRDDGPRLSGDQ